MNKNWLKFLGFLGLLGFLGFITNNRGFCGLFGFFGFFGFTEIKHDERFEANINKAGKNAFFSSSVFFALVVAFLSIYPNVSLLDYAFPASFALQVLVFTFSFQYYDQVGE